MKKIWTVTKNEFKRYFTSPLAYVYLVAFLLLNGSLAIYAGNFITVGQASLVNMFKFQPWIYLIFLSGISMRLWSEEFRSKTIIQIMTIPVSVSSYVWGKFLASWLFCGVALALTFTFWITANILGNPDNGVIAISYVGSLLLAGCMLAIAQTMSAITKNQVIALVLSVLVNLLFFVCGVEYILEILKAVLPISIVDMIASFSFLTHFNNIILGIFEARDLIFFASIILLFNFISIIIISFKTTGTTKLLQATSKKIYVLAFIILLLGFTGLNLIANNTLRNIKLDFTEEKIFTLTPSTKEIIKNLKEPVIAKLYYSKILGEKNPEYREYFNKTRLLLKEYSSINKDKFSYQIYYPETLNKAEDLAIANNLQPIPIIDSSSNGFFGLTLTDEADNKRIIPFFVLDRQNFIEQIISEELYLLNHKKKKIGLVTSLPMFDHVIENVATSQWEIITQIKKFYDLTPVDDKTELDDSFAAILLVHPSYMSKELSQNLINYGKKGGKFLAFVDIATEATRIYAPATNVYKASNISDLEKAWGIKFYKDYTIADLGNSISVDATIDYKNNPIITQDVIQFYIQEDGFNPNTKETSMLKKMLVSSASIILPEKGSKNLFVPLIKAGKNSQLMPSKVVYDNIHPSELLRWFEKDNNPKIIAAKIIGTENNNNFEAIVVADTDMLYDSFWSKSTTLLETNYFIPIMDNANFTLNALDSLTKNNSLIGLRGKSQKSRAFKQIQDIKVEATKNFKIKEKDIFDKIHETTESLEEITTKKTFEGREIFTPDELSIINNIKKKLNELRKELVEIKNNASNDIEHIYFLIKLFNIYAIPLLILLGYLSYAIIKNINTQKTSTSYKVNKEIIWLTIICTTLLTLGLISAYIAEKKETIVDDSQTVFTQAQKQINDISHITISGANGKLDFYNDNNIWKLKSAPDAIVLQDRIRALLSSIISAKYFEKKSNNAENLSKFGFLPIEDEASPSISIELKKSNGDIIEGFDVGKYNIDLGRGAQGAYIKFNNLFQVWLIDFDIVSLTADAKDWTFSSIWDLRLGRIASVNGISNPDTLANLMKNILNIKYESIAKSIPDAKLVLELDISAEQAKEVVISFYKSDDKIYYEYKFKGLKQNTNLQNFSNYATGKFYEINTQDLEKIENVITKQGTSK